MPPTRPGRLSLALSDALYGAVHWLCAPRRPTVSGIERLPAGAAVYLANHAGPQGPIAVVRALPARLHPWILDEMLSLRTAPRRMWLDVGRRWRLSERVGRAACAAASLLAVPFLRALAPVPVHRANGLFDACFDHSLALLRLGRSVLLFPEEPAPEPDAGQMPAAALDAADDGLRPFGAGLSWLCVRYLREVAPQLTLVMLLYRPARRVVEVLPPLTLHASDPRARDPRALLGHVYAVMDAAQRARGS